MPCVFWVLSADARQTPRLVLGTAEQVAVASVDGVFRSPLRFDAGDEVVSGACVAT